jgi:tetratricopeptide (TPR) repeat protein
MAGPVLDLAPFQVAGGVSTWAQMEEAYMLLAVQGESRHAEATALARSAVELAPLEPDAHEFFGRISADTAEGDAAYRRAIWLSADESPLRDALALRLWQRGDRTQALVEFEMSMHDKPAFAAHQYLELGSDLDPTSPQNRLHALSSGDSLRARLRLLDPAIRDAIERGLRGALDGGDVPNHRVTVSDLATLLEASGRYGDAAAVLEEWGRSAPSEDGYLRQAAANHLAAGNSVAAERALTEQLARTPDDGELYRVLAVDVYAARRDFDAANLALSAGHRHSTDLLPIYQGMREVLTLEQYRVRAAEPPAASATTETSVSSTGAPSAVATRMELP